MKPVFARSATPAAVSPLLPALRRRADELLAAAAADDGSDMFPLETVQILQETGCMRAVLPPRFGGEGLGWNAASATVLFDLLRALGGVHLSAARLFEGHVNAFQLLWKHGAPEQCEALCAYVREGGMLGVWNAPSPEGPMSLADEPDGTFLLHGVKAYASGAGYVRRPLVTATHPQRGLLMIWPEADYVTGPPVEWQMQGMRASASRSVRYRCTVDNSEIYGTGDDYHRQPLFSGGAWRFLAAQLGAGEMLCEGMRTGLRERGRSTDPHQRARLAECRAALGTACLWIARAAHDADDPALPADVVVARVAMARMVVERCLLDVIERVQRSVGLAAFSRTNPLERMARDLSTYLRQPAPDALRDGVGERAFETPGTTLTGSRYDCER